MRQTLKPGKILLASIVATATAVHADRIMARKAAIPMGKTCVNWPHVETTSDQMIEQLSNIDKYISLSCLQAPFQKRLASAYNNRITPATHNTQQKQEDSGQNTQ